jgi:nitroimidazol reductase NimA-like FMN-containing flavoprotein (pyridoxamine 5'-phosphate oxidase superfamily)
MEKQIAAGRAGARTASPEIQALDGEECWRYLKGQSLGRISFAVNGRPHVFPVNYVAVDETIVFRTAPGAKLDSGPGSKSCFEIDGYDRHSTEGWSVMAFGELEEITHADDERSRSLRELPLQPLAPGERLHWIALKVDEVAGRYFSGGWVVPGRFLG